MEFASSSSSFPKSKSRWTYDVFINFSGEDLRKNFISHLSYALSKAGVNPVLDGQQMELEELMKPEKSQISIVVFSKSYTESTWCLDELAKIIEIHETYGQRVVVVFYEIDPSHVRDQKGDFGKGLKAAARKRFSEEHLESGLSRWSQALTKAANFSGLDLKNCRDEAELVKQIVNDVLNKLEYEVRSVTKFPVGLESRVQEVIRFIENQSTKVCIIGIWGMGGVGKTTTAKAIYSQIHRRFMDKSFIESIRSVCETDSKGHVHLQEQLLSDVLNTKVKIHSIGMGTTIIEKRLSGKRVLIVLDDVNEIGQLEDLCGNCEWFGQGSVIIITTRDVGLLNLFKVDYVYKMEEMDENESLELFCLHAFGEPNPREDFNELARNVVAYCGGLPLALKVLGSNLRGRSNEEWESVLSKLKQIPNNEVQEILKISFDGLRDHMEKDIFFDVCCFFIGKDIAYVTDILNGCGLHADIGIPVLIERSLVKIEKNNKLGMHPLLQQMGREIIRGSSIKEPFIEPGKQSRLWFHEDVLDVLIKNTGTIAIEGLALQLHLSIRDCFKAEAFQEMKRLRLLRLDHVQLTGDYGYLSKQLRWIYWKGFPLNYIPNNFYLEGVIAIDLKHSNLKLLWKKTQVLQWLKILNLSHSKYLTETPDFSGLPSLEKLILKDCPRLRKVHQSIGDLHNLLLINLKDCTSLSNLPREIYKLKSVETLILSGCLNIDILEEDIVQMESLTTLISDNTAVKQVPFSIVNSKSIGYISICGFKGLSHDVLHSIILSWMPTTMNPLSHISLFSGTSSVSKHLLHNDLGDLPPMLSSISNLRSFLVQCDTEFQLHKQVKAMHIVYGVNYTELENSKNYLRSDFIGIDRYQVFNTLTDDSISEEMGTIEAWRDVLLPGDNHPYWLTHTGEGHSVCFTVPEDCPLKGMALCVGYSSTPKIMATKCLISVVMVNYTKCTIQIFKRDTVISFNYEDWQGIVSHFGPGDKVKIFVLFDHGLVVKKTAVYLACDKSIGKEMEPPPSAEKFRNMLVAKKFRNMLVAKKLVTGLVPFGMVIADKLKVVAVLAVLVVTIWMYQCSLTEFRSHDEQDTPIHMSH
ncbi:hypothetical protein JHK87_006732 [Glycine soja]|nr:hypothetical protein JHK87_006732 [Glycine soja]